MNWWMKLDRHITVNPKVRLAGRDAFVVYIALLGFASERDGQVSRWEADPRALASRCFDMAAAEVEDALSALAEFELIEPAPDGGLVILGWDDEWRPATPGAKRTAKWRANKKRVTKRDAPPVTGVTTREREEIEKNKGGGGARAREEQIDDALAEIKLPKLTKPKRRALAARLASEGFDPPKHLPGLIADTASARSQPGALRAILEGDPDDGVPAWRARLDAIAARERAGLGKRRDRGGGRVIAMDNGKALELDRESLGMTHEAYAEWRRGRRLHHDLARAGEGTAIEAQIAADEGLSVEEARAIAAAWEEANTHGAQEATA